jgi:hypothetical protein
LNYWDHAIKKCLNNATEFHLDSDKYVKIAEENLGGIYIIMFVKRCLRPHIKEIATSRQKLGRANMANKGSCSIRMKYKDSTLTFAAAHLQSGHVNGYEVVRRQ